MAYKPKGNLVKSGTGIIVAKRFDLNSFVHDLVLSACVEHAVANFNLKESESDFIETPVTFRTFVESKEHMAFPPLSERQYMLVDFMLGDDPDKMFSNLNTLAVVVWGKGSLLGHQEILTADGLRMTLSECATRNLPITVWSKTEAGRVSTQISTPAILKPNKEACFKLTTSFGHVSEASADHKYFTPDGWKKLKDLTKGDWICAAQTLPITPTHSETPQLGKLVGYMLGDGCMAGGNLSFYASNSNIINEFSNIVKYLGGRVTKKPGTTPGAYALTISRGIGMPGGHFCNPVKENLRRLGMLGHKAKTKRIPVQILFSSDATRKACIEGMYSTDGWISGRKGSPKSYEIGYVSKSRGLVDDLDMALRSFGIVGKIRRKLTPYRGEMREYWQLILDTAATQVKFCNLFTVTGKQHKQLQLLNDRTPGIIQGFSCPESLSPRLVSGIPSGSSSSKGGTYRGYEKRVNGGHYFGYDTVCEAPWMQEVANSDIHWEQVTDILPIGLHDVYTFTVPETHNYLQGGLFHHNSGKDSLCALILCYVCYILICMRSPQAYFSFPEGEYIDCVNVAPSGEKASTVFFEKIRQRLLLWRWLKDKFPVRSSGAFVSQVKANPGDPVVTITKDGIIFPKLIRLLSRNSDNESAEGLNTLIYIMDEASAFSDKSNSRNSGKVYRVLRSSCKTRFGNRGKGFIISYPREQNDFTMRMYRENLGNLHVYTDKAATWEVLPPGLRFNSGNFLFEGKEVPLELKEDFDKDPTESKMMYMAEPPEAEHGFIEYPEKIYECVPVGSRPIVTEEDYIKDDKICKRITAFSSDIRPDRDYIITVDLGHKSDSAALSVFHREDSGGKAIFVQDLVTGWIPDGRNKHLVSFENIKEYILHLASRINVIGCWFDQWQSISLRESLAAAAIPAYEYFLDYSDYKTFKEMLYTKRYQLQPHELQIAEMKHLVDKRTRVDHPQGGHNDYVDTVVGATKVFLMKYQNTKSSDEWGDVESISENLHMQDPWD